LVKNFFWKTILVVIALIMVLLVHNSYSERFIIKLVDNVNSPPLFTCFEFKPFYLPFGSTAVSLPVDGDLLRTYSAYYSYTVNCDTSLVSTFANKKVVGGVVGLDSKVLRLKFPISNCQLLNSRGKKVFSPRLVNGLSVCVARPLVEDTFSDVNGDFEVFLLDKGFSSVEVEDIISSYAEDSFMLSKVMYSQVFGAVGESLFEDEISTVPLLGDENFINKVVVFFKEGFLWLKSF